MNETRVLFQVNRKAFFMYADIRDVFAVGFRIEIFDNPLIAFRFYFGKIFFTFGFSFIFKGRE